MYTVLRFQCVKPERTLQDLGERLQRCTYIKYEGHDKGVANRISCTVATEDVWDDHIATVMQFLELSKELLEWARSNGVELSFDIAIEPDDYDGILGSFDFPHQLLTVLGESGIDLTISVYR